MRIVAFDEIPYGDGIGIKHIVIEKNNEYIIPSLKNKKINKENFNKLISEGCLTKIENPLTISDSSGMIFYIHKNFNKKIFNELCEQFELIENKNRGIFFIYLPKDQAKSLCKKFLIEIRDMSIKAFETNNFSSAIKLARKGLMLVPNVRKSKIASKLYEIIYRSEDVRNGAPFLVRQEASLALDTTNLPLF